MLKVLFVLLLLLMMLMRIIMVMTSRRSWRGRDSCRCLRCLGREEFSQDPRTMSQVALSLSLGPQHGDRDDDKENLLTYSTGFFTGPISSHLFVITSTFPLNTLYNIINSFFFFSVTLRGPPKTKLSHITFC